jgi:hypothetical protein
MIGREAQILEPRKARWGRFDPRSDTAKGPTVTGRAPDVLPEETYFELLEQRQCCLRRGVGLRQDGDTGLLQNLVADHPAG